MKRLARVLSATVVGTTCFAGVAAADISVTGPGSTNTSTTDISNKTTLVCKNNIHLNNSNDQNAQSGNATSSWNTVGGSAISGDATNVNSTSFNVDISGCVPEVKVPVQEVQQEVKVPSVSSVVAVVPGRGAAEVATTPVTENVPTTTTAAPVPAAGVGALPETGMNTASKTAITGIAAVGVLFALSQAGVGAYRKLLLG